MSGRCLTPGQLVRHALSFAEMRRWAVLCAGVIAASVAAPVPGADLIVAAALGAASWLVAESLLHRFVLHMPRPRARWLRRAHARLHWLHHKEPADPRLLFVPTWAALGLAGAAAAVGAAIGGPAAALGGAAGFALMFAVYEITHLAAHVPYRPRTALGALMRRRHLAHHFKSERCWFGVTHPLIDMVLGTWPRPDAVPRSSTVRDLFGDGGEPLE
ncbi:MAG: sterol desaturase family protein [Nannocystaceae bacterium]